ncbi:MAG: ABC transporter substrate-binding protein [Clostridia bacterium]|nr:ABC transporter substrate-binding protein [Clostridia bacterium]
MKKWVACMLALLMALSHCVVLAEDEISSAYEHLVVGNTTAFNGNFSTNMWGNNTADLDVEQLLFGYNLIFWQYEQGMFDVDPSVVTGIVVYDDRQGNRTYEMTLAEDLYYTDGTQITARDYAFSILFSVADEVQALNGNTDNYGAVLGMKAYKGKEADTLAGVRVLGDHRLAITIAAENLPFFYELGLLHCLPLPVHTIAPGCQVKDDGKGVYLDKSAGTFTVEALRETVLDPEDGYLSHPKVTSGPYKLISFDGEKAEFEINEYYKGNAQGIVPVIPYLTYKTVTNEEMLDQLQSGELGLINKAVNAESIDEGIRLVGENYARMSSYARVGYSFISFNCEKDTVSSQSVRQAMALCLDKDTLVSSYVGNYGMRVDSYYGIGQWMYQVLTGAMTPELPEGEEATEEDKKKFEETITALQEMDIQGMLRYELNVELANMLLDSDGWTLNRDGNAYQAGADDVRCKMVDGNLVALDLTMIYPAGNKMADYLQPHFIDHLAKAGIRVTLQPMEMEELLHQYYRQDERDCDMIYLATNFSEVFDPTLTYAPIDGINSNFSHLEDEKLHALAKDMAKTEPGDIGTYLQKWMTFEEYWAQVLPAIPVYSNAYFDFYTPLLQDYEINATATWSQAILGAYLGDRSETNEEGMESDFVEGGIIIID